MSQPQFASLSSPTFICYIGLSESASLPNSAEYTSVSPLPRPIIPCQPDPAHLDRFCFLSPVLGLAHLLTKLHRIFRVQRCFSKSMCIGKFNTAFLFWQRNSSRNPFKNVSHTMQRLLDSDLEKHKCPHICY